MLSRRNALGFLTLSPFFSRTAFGQSNGQFRGRVVVEWLTNDHRSMKLLEEFEFISASGRRWPVPIGTIVDGASIPQVFWSVIGGPYEGPYRGASVVHDYYCERRTRTYADVHRVFYDGMLAAGVGERRAWLMYQAVARFGPQWSDPKIDPGCEVVDKNYDFEKCAQNSTPPKLQQPVVQQRELLRFLDDVKDRADGADLQVLREAAKNL